MRRKSSNDILNGARDYADKIEATEPELAKLIRAKVWADYRETIAKEEQTGTKDP